MRDADVLYDVKEIVEEMAQMIARAAYELADELDDEKPGSPADLAAILEDLGDKLRKLVR